jgi:NitT/TauT family transport system substrate-binding protein
MRPDPAARRPLQQLAPLKPLNRQPRPVQPRHLLTMVAGIGALLLTGCSGGSGAGTPVSSTVTIAAAPGVDNVPLYIAQQKGLFAAAGLHVVIKPYASTAGALQAVENGQVNIAATDYANIFEEASAKGNVRILADGYDTGAGSAEILINPKYTNYSNPAQLRGVRIGLPIDSLVSTADTSSGIAAGSPAAVSSLLAAAAGRVVGNYLGSTGASELVWKPMSQQAEVSQLQSGSLKAALLTEPYIYQAEAGFGATALVDAFSAETANLPLSGYVALSPWVHTNPAAVADFQSAMATAQSEASMLAPVEQTLAKFPGMTTATAQMVSIGTYPQVTSSSALYRVELLLWRAGMLPRKLVDLPPLPQILVHG